MNTIKTVGIIGLGKAGWQLDYGKNTIKTHSKSIQSMSGMRLVFGVDKSLEKRSRWSEIFSVPAFENFFDTMGITADLIVVATSTDNLLPTLEEILSTNLSNVLIEKPVVSSDKDLTRLREISETFHNRILINFPRLYQPEIAQLVAFSNKLLNSNRTIQIDGEYSGGYINTMSHFLSLFNFLFGGVTFTGSNKSYDALNRYNLDLQISHRTLENFHGQFSAVSGKVVSSADFTISNGKATLEYLHGGDEVFVYDGHTTQKLKSTRDTYQQEVYNFIQQNGWQNSLKISGIASHLATIEDLFTTGQDLRC